MKRPKTSTELVKDNILNMNNYEQGYTRNCIFKVHQKQIDTNGLQYSDSWEQIIRMFVNNYIAFICIICY